MARQIRPTNAMAVEEQMAVAATIPLSLLIVPPARHAATVIVTLVKALIGAPKTAVVGAAAALRQIIVALHKTPKQALPLLKVTSFIAIRWDAPMMAEDGHSDATIVINFT